LWTIFLGWPQTLILPISASQVGRITGVSHQHLAKSFSLSAMLSEVMRHIWDVGTRGALEPPSLSMILKPACVS
jgi:hypothetical protein